MKIIKNQPVKKMESTLKIYHVREDAPHGTAFFEHPESWDERKEHYKLVAQGDRPPLLVGLDHRDVLEDVFGAEQNGVNTGESTTFTITEEETPRRSLSVGDVVILDGTPYEVGSVGFRNIKDRNEQGTMGDTPMEILSEDEMEHV